MNPTNVTNATPTMDAGRFVGQSITRKEDPRLLTGRGRFVDDVTRPGMLHAAFLRMSKDGKIPSLRQIGSRIRSMSGQNNGGLKFQKCGESDHAAVWRVARV